LVFRGPRTRGLSAHSLRGCPLNLHAAQVLFGHASIATTERYLAVDDSEIRVAMVAAIGVDDRGPHARDRKCNVMADVVFAKRSQRGCA
jgi:hypothetical protein